MKPIKRHYESPSLDVLSFQPQQILESSNELQDYQNNPIYRENF